MLETGCFIYMRPPLGLDVATTSFEASQNSFFHSVGGNYQVVDGLTILFTQSTAIFTESAHYVLIQNSSFGHTANGNDNSYNLRLWGSDGSIVRRNRVWDSRYWGGAVNSHGTRNDAPGPDEPVAPSRIFNNVFMNTERAVETLRMSSQPFVRNNISIGSGHGLYFSAGGETTWPDFCIEQGLDSDFNVFFTSDEPVYVYANWSGTEEALSLSDYQSRYGGDESSSASDPMLDDDLAPLPGSSALGTGDPSVYAGVESVNRGLFPFLTP